MQCHVCALCTATEQRPDPQCLAEKMASPLLHRQVKSNLKRSCKARRSSASTSAWSEDQPDVPGRTGTSTEGGNTMGHRLA
ncbi:unnamed protein product [Ixodes pacificus]